MEPLVPGDIFDLAEEDVLKSYNSAKSRPLVAFLGLDESRPENGLSYKNYKGTPYFALDVTPQGPLEEKAKGIVETMEAKGLSFHGARTITALPADDGMDLLFVLFLYSCSSDIYISLSLFGCSTEGKKGGEE